ncbi:hypothetical protein [Dermacoccus sp. Ellin185]|nr:hypothetical protein [Dermacoccus sp. Ellin185]EFP59552.1 Tat pathway signal sequence domain protein [Dermacoccus sp. Ellin185]
MNKSPTPILARRSVLTLAMTGALGALAACGGDKEPAKASISGTGSAPTTANSPKITPVDGFSSTAAWSSTQVKDLAPLVPVPEAGATWYQDRAWFLMATGTDPATGNRDVHIVALDPATKKVTVSPVVNKKLMDGTRTQWVTITHPSPALLLDTGGFSGGSVLVKLSGGTITTTPLSVPSVDSFNAVWMGDVIFAIATRNGEGSGSFYDPTKNTYTTLAPQHGGRIIGASVNGGKVMPLELVGGTEGKPTTRLYANGHDASSGIAGDEGQDRAIHAMAWTTNGKIVLSVDGPTNGDVIYVPYGTDLKPAARGAYPRQGNPDRFDESSIGDETQPQAISADRTQAILSNGLLYDTVQNKITRGIWTDPVTMSWDLNNTAVTTGHLYGNASSRNRDARVPTTGAYASTTGALTEQNQPNKTAPALVLPNGDGLFLDEAAEVLAGS